MRDARPTNCGAGYWAGDGPWVSRQDTEGVTGSVRGESICTFQELRLLALSHHARVHVILLKNEKLGQGSRSLEIMVAEWDFLPVSHRLQPYFLFPSVCQVAVRLSRPV